MEAQDAKLLEAVDLLARGEMPEGLESDPYLRETVEALALLPYALEPSRELGPVPELPPKPRPVERLADVLPGRFGRGRGSARRWLLPVAAGLFALTTFLALGVGVFRRDARIERLEARLQAAGLEQRDWVHSREEIRELRERWHLVTSSPLGVCSLRPPAEARRGEASGTLYATPREGFLLVARDLPTPSPKEIYAVWWLVEGGWKRAGELTPVEPGRAELLAADLPAGSRGVLVTLEARGWASEPLGPELLVGDAADMVEL